MQYQKRNTLRERGPGRTAALRRAAAISIAALTAGGLPALTVSEANAEVINRSEANVWNPSDHRKNVVNEGSSGATAFARWQDGNNLVSSSVWSIFRRNSVSVITDSDGTLASTFSADGVSIWRDNITLTGPAINGSMTFDFHLTGLLSGSPSIGGSTVVVDFTFDTEDNYCQEEYFDILSGPDVVDETFSVTVSGCNTSNPIEMEGLLRASSFVRSTDSGRTSADFSNSLVLDLVTLHDGGGFTAESGTNYLIPFASGDVPEPATLALFGAGLAGLGFLRRRRKA